MKLLEELTGAQFRFTARPTAIPPDLRPVWRMTILVLFLQRCCRQGKSSLKKLHVLNWAIRHPASRQTLLDVLDGRARPDRAIVRFDPALNRALDLADFLDSLTRCQRYLGGAKLHCEAQYASKLLGRGWKRRGGLRGRRSWDPRGLRRSSSRTGGDAMTHAYPVNAQRS